MFAYVAARYGFHARNFSSRTQLRRLYRAPAFIRPDVEVAYLYDNKRQIFSEAQCAAIRIALFDGVGIPPYTKPLLSDGEQTMNQTHPDYFNNLLYSRYSDFIGSCTAISKFKKSDNKSTLFVVNLKILLLRKDLEKNNIKRQIGY